MPTPGLNAAAFLALLAAAAAGWFARWAEAQRPGRAQAPLAAGVVFQEREGGDGDPRSTRIFRFPTVRRRRDNDREEEPAEPAPPPDEDAAEPGDADNVPVGGEESAPVVSIASRRAPEPRTWNLWELESAARAEKRVDPARAEERLYLFFHLRQFADADGDLPPDFDGLVREAFGDLLDPLQPG
ncbi:MAG TPA: hypothetical protein VHK22_07140 [Gaiellaceae bacterium]|nr:hypothetical protein [Gaiellaceae bacterium]